MKRVSEFFGRFGARTLRTLLAALSLAAMAGVFLLPAWGVRVGWLTHVQLVPAIMAGSVLELALIAFSVALFGRLYCSVVCPLGIAQDLFRFAFGWMLPKRGHAQSPSYVRWVRYGILALFVVGAVFGFTGLIAPYGIFGRFLAVGIRRVGEPAVVMVVWAIGLFAFVLAMTFVRARWWCNRVCPVGTFLGLFSRFAVFRVRIDAAKCVRCGLCAKTCDKGALAVRDDKSIAVDASSCVACFNCVGSCRKEALTWR